MELNPSISGWINKFNKELFHDLKSFQTDEDYFISIINSGLLYGKIVDYHLKTKIDDDLWSEENKAQFCLFTSALSLFQLRKKENNLELFLKTLLKFYKEITHYKKSWFENILPETKNSIQVEEFIKDRISNNENFLLQTFSHYALNAFLFQDIICFDYFLKHDIINEEFFKTYEKQCLQVLQNAIDSKTIKNQNDELFLKLFKKSLKYNKEDELKYEQFIDFQSFTDLQKMYVLNLCQFAICTDSLVSTNESEFLNKLEIQVYIEASEKIKSNFLSFFKKYHAELPYLQQDSSVKVVYNKVNNVVSKLLLKNKNRLQTEILESKELFSLLIKSRNTKLTNEEKKKVKQQLKDVLKTIPSLTIFLLPGGGLLMPILIKFIPQILPSSFNENIKE